MWDRGLVTAHIKPVQPPAQLVQEGPELCSDDILPAASTQRKCVELHPGTLTYLVVPSGHLLPLNNQSIFLTTEISHLGENWSEHYKLLSKLCGQLLRDAPSANTYLKSQFSNFRKEMEDLDLI